MCTTSKGRKYKLLKRLNLILQAHEVCNRLVTLIGIVDALQADVLFILEGAVELGMVAVEGQLVDEEEDVFLDELPISPHAIAHSASRHAS